MSNGDLTNQMIEDHYYGPSFSQRQALTRLPDETEAQRAERRQAILLSEALGRGEELPIEHWFRTRVQEADLLRKLLPPAEGECQ